MPRRNEECPCGSGKKYKKCCLIKQHEHESQMRMLARVEQMKEMPCLECDSGKKWKDCCLAKRLASPIAKAEAGLQRVTGTSSRMMRPRAPVSDPLPVAKVV